MNIHNFYRDLHPFSTAMSIDEITELCRFHCHQLGFDAFIYALRIPTCFSEARVIVINGYPAPWIDRYWEHGYHASDPVIAHCKQCITPVKWHDLMIDKHSLSEQVMAEAAELGLKAGISMPVHSPHGVLGVLSFAINSNNPTVNNKLTQYALPYLPLLAGSIHEAVLRVSNLTNKDSKLLLTAREVECIRWAAAGKTSGEIAQLLNLSERTINFHLNNTMIKLEVNSRQHAAVKAALQGLIDFTPF